MLAAVGQGHLHVAEILVKNGADVNYRNKVRVLIPVTHASIHNMANNKAWYTMYTLYE